MDSSSPGRSCPGGHRTANAFGRLGHSSAAVAGRPVLLIALLALGSGLSGSVGGCASAVREAGREAAEGAAPPGIRIAIQEVANPQNQALLAQAGEGPGTQRLTEGVGRGLGRGMVDYVVGLLFGEEPPADTTGGAAGIGTAAGTSVGGRAGGGAAAGRNPPSGPSSRPALRGLANVDWGSKLGGARTELVATVREVVTEITRAVTAALSNEVSKAGVRDLASAATAGVTREVARSARDDLGPAAAAAIHDHVGPAVGRMLREQVVPAVGQAIKQEVAPAVGAMMKEQVAPALGSLMKEQVGPAVRAAAKEAAAGVVDGLLEQRRPDQGTLAEASRQITKGGALGARDAVVEAGIPNPSDPLKEAAKTLDRVMWLAVALMVVAGVMAIGLLMGMTILGYAVWKGRVPANQQAPPTPAPTR